MRNKRNIKKQLAGITQLEVLLVCAILVIVVTAVIRMRSGGKVERAEEQAARQAVQRNLGPESPDWDWESEAEDDEAAIAQGDAAQQQTVREVLGRPAETGLGGSTQQAYSVSYRQVGFQADGSPTLREGAGEEGADEALGKKDDRPSALEVLKSLIESSTKHKRALDYVLQEVDGDTIGDALAMVEGMPWGPEANYILQGLMVRWGQLDPAAAIDYAGSLTSRRARSSSMGKALSGWAQDDPRAAYSWFSENAIADPGTLSMSVKDLFTSMAQHDEAWAWERLWELPTSSMKANALRSLVGYKPDADKQQQMMAMYNGMVPGDDRSLIARTLVSSWALYQPEEAARWVSSLTDPESRRTAMNSLVRSWGYDQPERAAEWIMDLPSKERRTEMSHLIGTWSRTDPIEAADWLGQFQPSPELDPAVKTLVRAVMKEDPPGAMIWAETITSRKQRESSILQVGYYWMKTDPAACRSYMANANLSPKVKKRFR